MALSKSFGMMVARDGVEPPMGIEPSEVTDSTMDIRDRSDYLDIFPARIQYTDLMEFCKNYRSILLSARDGVSCRAEPSAVATDALTNSIWGFERY
jgi:hypothetical protein